MQGKGMTIQACKTDTRTKLQPSGTDLPRQLKHDHPQSENRYINGPGVPRAVVQSSCNLLFLPTFMFCCCCCHVMPGLMQVILAQAESSAW